MLQPTYVTQMTYVTHVTHVTHLEQSGGLLGGLLLLGGDLLESLTIRILGHARRWGGLWTAAEVRDKNVTGSRGTASNAVAVAWRWRGGDGTVTWQLRDGGVAMAGRWRGGGIPPSGSSAQSPHEIGSACHSV